MDAKPLTDEHGLVLFHCRICRQPLSADDFFDLGLRLPDRGESAGDCYDAELLDAVEHAACLRSARAG